MSFDLQLNGLRALVTGGTKGVGAANVAQEVLDRWGGVDILKGVRVVRV